MDNETQTSAATTEPVSAPAPITNSTTPVTTTSSSFSSDTSSVSATSTVEAPVTPSVEAPVVETKPEETSIIGEALKESPPKEAETKSTESPTSETITKTSEEGLANKEEGQSDEPAPPPTYDPFVLPEGITLDDERSKEFTSILAELETKTKADHALVQEFGQKAVDFHIAEIKRAVDALNSHYQSEWENTKNSWKDSFMKDPEIGGNRWKTTVDAAQNFIRTHGGTAEQQAEFRNLMNMSGVGNHPAMIRLLANAGRAMSEGRPLAAKSPAPAPKSKVAAMYGKTS